MENLRTLKNGQPLQDVIALLFTPFSADGKSVDAASMHRQLDRVLEAGVAGVVACGKAGEFEGINAAEFEQVLSLVLEGVAGQVPVGAGIISVEREAGVQAAACAAGCGADFAMVKKLSRQRLHEFYLEIAERLPVMVYDQSNEGNLDLEREALPLLAQPGSDWFGARSLRGLGHGLRLSGRRRPARGGYFLLLPHRLQ